MSNQITLTGSRLINTTVENAYEKLINPAEQIKWNTLYLEASIEPNGTIKNGTIMSGIFKGSGKAIVIFQNVILNKEFTHYSKMKLFNVFYLGEFYHTYKVEYVEGKTMFSQTIIFTPKKIGLILKNVIVDGFKKRLPESFNEFQNFIEGNGI